MPEPELNALGAQQRRVLEIIWEKNGATVQQVLDEMNRDSETPLAYTTVLATMQKLEKTGWLQHASDPKHGRAYVYRATCSRNEAIGDSLCSFANTFLDGSKKLLFQHFLSDTNLSDAELDEIRKMIEKRRKP